jgi:roadblock/LC7 domain-containing protein
MEALRYETYEMPPKGKLPDTVIASFEKWINMGAPDPRSVASAAPAPRRSAFSISESDRRHWSFQPMKKQPVPKVRVETWAKTDIDRFVLANLEKYGIAPAPPANRETLLRRVTFALTGLSPEPAIVDAFLADQSPNAYEKVVDRLLASTDFGIQWGRHWLDGVRYADSIDKSGVYKNWVFQSLNDDLPYNEFIRLQIAGDLIPAKNVGSDKIHDSGASLDGITATGMLSLASWEQVGRDFAVAEIVDSQMDLVGRQFMGLTLACARCHDHKFDPVSAEDYYGLAGVFFSSHIVDGTLIADDRLGNNLLQSPLLNREQAAFNRGIDQQVAKIQSEIAAVEKKIPQAARLVAVKTEMTDVEAKLAKATATTKKMLTDQSAKLKAELEKLEADQKKNGWATDPPELATIRGLKEKVEGLKKTKKTAPTAVVVAEGGVPGSNRAKIGDAPVYIRGDYQREGKVVPRRFPVILAGENQPPLGKKSGESGRRELADWLASPDHPLVSRVMVNRIWQHLMGRGLVRSPDNFGLLGERPTHPQLLDYLALRFIDSGWSTKRLVREIVLSSTFRQSSRVGTDEYRNDPENERISHYNRRRLTYEEMRDSLLASSGRLAATSVQQPSGSKLTGGLLARTAFEPQDRKKANVTSAIFDGPDPKSIVPQRAETTTTPQALFLMNNGLVTESAVALAGRLQDDGSLKTDTDRIRRLWLVLYNRPAAGDEVEMAERFLAENTWEELISALYCTNEFAYID